MTKCAGNAGFVATSAFRQHRSIFGERVIIAAQGMYDLADRIGDCGRRVVLAH
jgi:hypothetical protein